MTDSEFLQWLRDQNPYIICLENCGDGRWVSLERLMFHHTIKVGTIGDELNGYDDRWCVGDLENALRSWLEWKERAFQGEPTGWNRHPSTGRRRPDGNPEHEYVSF